MMKRLITSKKKVAADGNSIRDGPYPHPTEIVLDRMICRKYKDKPSFRTVQFI